MTTRPALALLIASALTTLAGAAAAETHRAVPDAVATRNIVAADAQAAVRAKNAKDVKDARDARDARDPKAGSDGARRNLASSGSGERDGDPYAVPLFKDAAQLH